MWVCLLLVYPFVCGCKGNLKRKPTSSKGSRKPKKTNTHTPFWQGQTVFGGTPPKERKVGKAPAVTSSNGCGSKTVPKWNPGKWKTWTKTCGLPLLLNFEPHPNRRAKPVFGEPHPKPPPKKKSGPGHFSCPSLSKIDRPHVFHAAGLACPQPRAQGRCEPSCRRASSVAAWARLGARFGRRRKSWAHFGHHTGGAIFWGEPLLFFWGG